MTKTEQAERNEKLALEILAFLRQHGMWQDTTIFFNGKALSTSNYDRDNPQHHYDEQEPFTLDPFLPKFEYAAPPDRHILSMSWDGPLHNLLNYGEPSWKLQEEFRQIFVRHGVWYEQGHSWNLTCYEKR